MPTYLPYSDSIETIKPGEEQTFDDVAKPMGGLTTLMNDRYRHAIRSVHAKSHGLLKATLKVHASLPEPLAQGLFAAPGEYGTILRFSTNPGDILADSVSTPRGIAMKVVGVNGAMLPENAGQFTQDFVLVNSKTFPAPDAEHFLKLQKVIVANANDPEIFKKAVSASARGINAVLGLVGVESDALTQLGHPGTHILGETFASCAAIRYGNYVAKIAVVPVSKNLTDLTGKHITQAFHYSVLRDAVVEFFKTETAVWDVRVQLCTDLEKNAGGRPEHRMARVRKPVSNRRNINGRPAGSLQPQAPGVRR